MANITIRFGSEVCLGHWKSTRWVKLYSFKRYSGGDTAAMKPESLVCIPGGRSKLLPPSNSTTLLTLHRVLLDKTETEVARSYLGHSWEPVPPRPFFPECSETGGIAHCTFTPEGDQGGSFIVRRHMYEQLIPAAAMASRFLMQATFGPTRTDLNRFTNATSWLDEQIAVPASYHTPYFRARRNPRPTMRYIKGGVGTKPELLFGSCDVGSRWHAHAFNTLDHTYRLFVHDDEVAGRFTLRTLGVLRTELVSFDNVMWDANSTVHRQALGWALNSSSQAYEFFFVTEANAFVVKSQTKLNASSVWLIREDVYLKIANPPIVFTTVDTATTVEYAAGDIDFHAPTFAQGVQILKSFHPSTTCVNRYKSMQSFLKYGGVFYKVGY